MRSPIKQTVTPTAAGGAFGPWIPLDYTQRPFNVALMVSLSSDAAGITYSVEYTPDNPNQGKSTRNNLVSLLRAAAVATAVFANPHGVVTGDALKVYNSGDPNLDGDQAITAAPSITSLQYACGNTGLLVASPYVEAIPIRVYPHATLVALAAKAAGNFAFPCMACRLHITAWTAGSATLEVIQGYGRG